jgi:prepilin-type N-terminal cleavage/methylation domain-containing protein
MATSRSRSAYTLMEMIVVMAIIVMLGAAIYPSLEDSYDHFKVTAAADAVKGAWAEARARAIEDCMPYRFAVVPGTPRFRVAPDKPEFWSGGGSPDQGATGNRPPLVRQGSLPKDILFDGKGGSAPQGNGNKDDDAENAPVDPSAWVTKAVFLPTGEASDDYELKLEMKNAQPIILQLRSLTGTVKTITTKEGR